ncbi:peroxiredoxin family protein [Sphingobacterium faecale]|uniref:Redoxin domain-containing protein n=1 Tax=Sphingobacterium faecale TaxID=2803775 RepID=A0ABS1R1U4_9SPHI|nr:redoxin domain-containing protein [Sphingobacterium faecale]MBL1408666.1 redoxin domain-containing protein [Sphingobacterium faecale]
MNKMIIPAYLIVSVSLGLSSCSNTPSNTEKTKTEVDDHQGHDHSGHDHSAHEHNTNSAAPPASESNMSNLAQGDPIAQIPAFTFYKVKSGISFTNTDIPAGKKTAFILFDPGCSHCRTEAAALGKNYDRIKGVNIYFVSMNDPALMASFLETFAKELVGKPNVEVLYDRNQEFIQKFHVPGQFPANYVYGKDNKLQVHWEGDKNINEIIGAYTK